MNIKERFLDFYKEYHSGRVPEIVKAENPAHAGDSEAVTPTAITPEMLQAAARIGDFLQNSFDGQSVILSKVEDPESINEILWDIAKNLPHGNRGVLQESWSRTLIGQAIMTELVKRLDRIVIQVTGVLPEFRKIAAAPLGAMGPKRKSQEERAQEKQQVEYRKQFKEQQKFGPQQFPAQGPEVAQIIALLRSDDFFNVVKNNIETVLKKPGHSKWQYFEKALDNAANLEEVYKAVMEFGAGLRFPEREKITVKDTHRESYSVPRQSALAFALDCRYSVVKALAAGDHAALVSATQALYAAIERLVANRQANIETGSDISEQGGEDMEKHSNLSLDTGTPVKIKAGGKDVFVTVGMSEDNSTAYTIKLSDLNAHSYIEPTPIAVSDLEVLRVFHASAGDIVESGKYGSLRIIAAQQIGDICFVDAKHEDGHIEHGVDLATLDVAPAPIVCVEVCKCPTCGGYITENKVHDDCPAARGPDRIATAAVLEQLAKDNQAKLVDYEQERFNTVVSRLLDVGERALDSLEPAHFLGVGSGKTIVANPHSNISVGSRVAKKGYNATGIIIGATKRIFVVEWPDGSREPCWSQELAEAAEK